MWDQRYGRPGYLFGTAPAQFLTRHEQLVPRQGECLCVADGEGRNSVWLAKRGLTVTAMDSSTVGLEKARALAAREGARVAYRLADLQDWEWEADRWDVLAAIFIQFAAPDFRDRLFAGFRRTIRPGGTLLLHGYRPEQVTLGTGGPPCAENMYTEEMLRDAFGDWQMDVLASHDTVIEEGAGHSGPSALIDLIARKPSRE